MKKYQGINKGKIRCGIFTEEEMKAMKQNPVYSGITFVEIKEKGTANVQAKSEPKAKKGAAAKASPKEG